MTDRQPNPLAYRDREQQGNHIRSIGVQTLDAMLRIEELLQQMIATYEAQGATVTRVGDEISVELPARVQAELPDEQKTTRKKPRSL